MALKGGVTCSGEPHARSDRHPWSVRPRQGETRRWVLNGGSLAGPQVCSPRVRLLVSNPISIAPNKWMTDDRKENGSMPPTHGDDAILKNQCQCEIKNEELATLERVVDGLNVALASRTVIGIALGIIIERHHVTEPQSFQILKKLSQHSNVKLRDIAARMANDAQPFGSKTPQRSSRI